MRLAQSQSQGSLITREKKVLPLLPVVKEYLSPPLTTGRQQTSRSPMTWVKRIDDTSFQPFHKERDHLGRLIVQPNYFRDISAASASALGANGTNLPGGIVSPIADASSISESHPQKIKFTSIAIRHLDEFYNKNMRSPIRGIETYTDRSSQNRSTRLPFRDSTQVFKGFPIPPDTDDALGDQFKQQKREFFNDIAKLYTSPQRKLCIHKKKEPVVPGIGQYDLNMSENLKFKKSPMALIRKENLSEIVKPKENLQKLALQLVSQHTFAHQDIEFLNKSESVAPSIFKSRIKDEEVEGRDIEDAFLDKMNEEINQLPREFRRKMNWAQEKVTKIQGDLKNWNQLVRGEPIGKKPSTSEINQFTQDDDDLNDDTLGAKPKFR